MIRPATITLCLLTPLLAGGCASSGTAADARKLLDDGDPRGACRALFKHLHRDQPRPVLLSALRTWIDACDQAGELESARRRVGKMPRDGGRLYAEALLLLAASVGDLPRVVALLDEAGKRWPRQGEIPYRAGLLLLADDQSVAALARLDRACKLTLTAACAVTRAHALLNLGRINEALESARRVPDLEPRPADVRRGQALIIRLRRRTLIVPASVLQRYRKALDLLHSEDKAGACITHVEQILLDHPRLAAAHTLLGLAHVRLDNGAAAIVSLRRAAELNPLDPTNPYYIALVYKRRARLQPMTQQLQRTLQLDPFHMRGAALLGEALLQLKRPKEAVKVLDRLRALDGGSAMTLRLAGRAQLSAGDFKRAEATYGRLLELEPKDFELNLRMAQLLLRRHGQGTGGDAALVKQVAEHLKVAAEVRPGDPALVQMQAVLDKLAPQ